MRIAIVSDAYYPHISGVARSIEATKNELEKWGHTVRVIAPRDYRFRVPFPLYPEIELVLFPYRKLAKMLDEFQPDSLHLSVEGPLGMAGRRYAKERKLHFTTAYHTRFPEYLNIYLGIPTSWTYAIARWFHNSAAHVMVAAESLRRELHAQGVKNTVLWTRGVDFELFTPDNPLPLAGERPIYMYMGRVALEKNLDAFLSLDVSGTKYVIGGGPAFASLKEKYPGTVFIDYKFGKELAQHLAAADVFVFPSLTDTLGLVMLEANACGVPIAALPSQASTTEIREGENGCVRENLAEACRCALALSRARAREVALEFGWDKPAKMFLQNLVPARSEGEK